MINGSDVKKVLVKYLLGEIDMPALREWIVDVHISEKQDAEAHRLISNLEARYAEFSDGLGSEDFLRARLRDLLQPTTNSAQNANAVVYIVEQKDIRSPYPLSANSGSVSSVGAPFSSCSPRSSDFEVAV